MQKLSHVGVPPVLYPACGTGRRAGGSLVVVMVMVIAVTLIGSALIGTTELNGVELVREQQTKQAFCLAEGGLYHAVARLRTDSAYRTAPTGFTNDLGGGRYVVSSTFAGPIYTNTSQARVGNAYHTLRQIVTVIPNDWLNADAALVSGGYIKLLGVTNIINGDIIADGDVSISGQVARVNGDIIADGDVRLPSGGIVASGTVQVTAGNTVSPSSLPQSPPPDPLPGLTDWSAKKAFFDSQIAIAAVSGKTWTNTEHSFYLNGKTNYFKGNVTQKYTTDAATPAIYGPGMLVASGNMKNLYKITGTTNGVTTIICDDQLQLGTGGSPDSFPIVNCVLYSAYTSGNPTAKDMWLDCPDLSFSNSIILSVGNIAARSFDMLDADTVFMSLGSILLGDGNQRRFDLAGRLEAAVAITADKSTTLNITHPNLPPLPPGFEGKVTITRVQWVDGGSDPF